MALKEILSERKANIVADWIARVLNTYQESNFFKKQKDRFANPVGAAVSEGLHHIFAVLLEQSEIHAAKDPLENILKIRAVQNFAPSQAVFFLFELKELVRNELVKAKVAGAPDLADFEAKIDALALMGFDLYMDSRERLFQIRIKELQSGSHILTDGTKCPSALLRMSQKEATGKNSNVHSSS